METDSDDTSPAATEALAFMVVALNAPWKLPIGYFIIRSLTSDEKSNIIELALKKLHSISVRTVSLTCDSAAANLSSLKKLGASFDADNMRCTIPHPSDSNIQICIIMDPCHLVKLARNTLSDYKVLKDGDGNEIR